MIAQALSALAAAKPDLSIPTINMMRTLSEAAEKMEIQHRKITGYRELSEGEIALMNQIKQVGQNMGELFAELEQMASVDKRWLAIAKTDLQKGLMSMTRAIAKPTTF